MRSGPTTHRQLEFAEPPDERKPEWFNSPVKGHEARPADARPSIPEVERRQAAGAMPAGRASRAARERTRRIHQLLGQPGYPNCAKLGTLGSF